MVSKCREDLPLQPNKAGIFVFNLFVYKKIEFSKKPDLDFSKKLCKQINFVSFKNPALLGCRGQIFSTFWHHPEVRITKIENKIFDTRIPTFWPLMLQ